MMLSSLAKKTAIKNVLKWIFGGLSIVFIGILFFMVVHDAMTGATSDTTLEYCAKYGFLASPDC